MIATRPFNFMAIANALALTILLIGMSSPAFAQDDRLNANVIQDRDYPSRSNSEPGRRILANAPPAVPGYRQFMGFIFAVLDGEAEIVPLSPPVPDNVSEHQDLMGIWGSDQRKRLKSKYLTE